MQFAFSVFFLMNIQLINYNQCLIVGHPNSVLARQAKTKFGTNDPIKCTQIYENVMQLFWQLCCKNTKCAEIMQSRYLNYNIILWMCILKSWFHEPRCLKSTKKLPKLTFLPVKHYNNNSTLDVFKTLYKNGPKAVKDIKRNY